MKIPKKSAVLVMDMLYDFFYGNLKCERCKKIIPHVKKLISLARKNKIPVIYVCDTHRKNDPEFKKWPPHAIEGTKGGKILSDLKPKEFDFLVRKRRYGGFWHTDLDLLLRELGIKHLIISGVLADICIQHTAAEAFFLGYKITIPKETTEALSDEAREWAFKYMEYLYGAKIVSLKKLF
jgi:nicotinamidase-related amidase